MKKRYLLYILICVLLLGWTKYEISSSHFSRKGTSYKKGDPLRYFSLPSLEGQQVDIQQVVAHHAITWISFYNIDCKPCRYLLPMMEKIYRKYQDKGLGVVAVSVGETRRTIHHYVNRSSAPFPVLLDSNNVQAKKINLQSLPVSMLVDSSGKIISLEDNLVGIQFYPWRINSLLTKDH